MRPSDPERSSVERFSGAPESSPWWGVHAARYLLAGRILPGGRLLDVACGTGYGLPLLRGRLSRVVGVDVSLDAAIAAQCQGASSVVGRAECLPFAGRAFEAVASFETLEHFESRAVFVRELARVLRPGGIGIISTPNARYSCLVNGVPRNPFHIHEYTPEEFRSELGAAFSSVELLGQTLHPKFRTSPFWDDQQRIPRTYANMARLLLWKLIKRGPAKERVARALLGHAITPSADDYEFLASTVDDAPVLIAICS